MKHGIKKQSTCFCNNWCMLVDSNNKMQTSVGQIADTVLKSIQLTIYPESIDNFCILSLWTFRSSHWCLGTLSGFAKISVERFLFSSPLIWAQKTYQEQKYNKEALERFRGVVSFCSATSSIALPLLTGSFSEKKNHCFRRVIYMGRVHISPTSWSSRSLNNRAGHISYCIGVISGIHF